MPEVTCQIHLGRYHTRPIGLTLIRRCGSLAQLVEQLAFNQLVAGSNPARPTIFSHFIKYLLLVDAPSNFAIVFEVLQKSDQLNAACLKKNL